MELILLKDTRNRNISQMTTLVLQRAGYVFLDPEHYLTLSPFDDDVCFRALHKAKQWCLVNAITAIHNGQPIAMNGDFINNADLQVFFRLGCRIETLNTDDIGRWLRSKKCIASLVKWPPCASLRIRKMVNSTDFTRAQVSVRLSRH